MARVKTQDIPPALAAYYKKMLGKTRAIAYPGSHYPELDQSVRRHFPLRLEPPNIPTYIQLQRRAYFKQAVNCFNGAPYNERTCYYRLSLPSGLFYYDYYLHLNILRFAEGETCAQIRKPLASCFKGEGPDTWGCIQALFNYPGIVYFDLQAWLGPANFENHYGPQITTAYGVFIETWLFYYDPPYWGGDFFPIYPDPAGGPWEQSFEIGYFGPSLRRVTFYRSASNPSESILWLFAARDRDNSYTYENWNPITL